MSRNDPPRRQPIIRMPDQQNLTSATQLQTGQEEIMSIGYVECAHCGETVGTYYVTYPYCWYKLAARKPTTGMDPLYGMTDDEFYKRFGSM